MNKEGWDPAEEGVRPTTYGPGKPFPASLDTRSTSPAIVVGDKDFNDKCLIHNVIRSLLREKSDQLYRRTNQRDQRFFVEPYPMLEIELVCKPVAEGGYRGVVVQILRNEGALNLFGRKTKSINIYVGVVDFEFDGTNKASSVPGKGLERGTLPPRPEETLEELVAHFERFAKANPGQVGEAAEACRRIAETFRPLETSRELGIQDAMRITRLSEAWIYQLADEGRLGQKIGSRWKFSEKELHDFAQQERSPGRPPTRIENATIDEIQPPDVSRGLGIQDAVRITGLSEPRIYQLADEGRLGQKIGSRWKFSEIELRDYAQEERRPGPRPKNTQEEFPRENQENGS